MARVLSQISTSSILPESSAKQTRSCSVLTSSAHSQFPPSSPSLGCISQAVSKNNNLTVFGHCFNCRTPLRQSTCPGSGSSRTWPAVPCQIFSLSHSHRESFDISTVGNSKDKPVRFSFPPTRSSYCTRVGIAGRSHRHNSQTRTRILGGISPFMNPAGMSTASGQNEDIGQAQFLKALSALDQTMATGSELVETSVELDGTWTSRPGASSELEEPSSGLPAVLSVEPDKECRTFSNYIAAEGSVGATAAPCSALPPSLLVFSGGTAFNGVAESLSSWTTHVTHVLPVSDDGGSTAEIVRVIGGPAIGDIRSRCLRLSDASTSEAIAVKQLLGHRLPLDPKLAKEEWYRIVEGDDPLWNGVSEPYKDTIRAFLVHFQHQILRNSSLKFSFQNGSVGNFFFAGARSFFCSLDAAIFLFSRVSHIPPSSLVLPCVRTNDRLTLGAELQDGSVIRGQHQISHPCVLDSPCPPLHRNSVDKSPDSSPPLPSPIRRIFYMSSEGTNLLHEVFPAVNPRILERISTADATIYGMGSLYTSICPSLVLKGMGEAIASRQCHKILLLNGTYDRETNGMSASDFVVAITEALNRTHCHMPLKHLHHQPSAYITTVVAPKGGAIPVDQKELSSLGIPNTVFVESQPSEHGGMLFDNAGLVDALRMIIETRDL